MRKFIAAAAGIAMACAPCVGGELKADQETLFFCDFNKGVDASTSKGPGAHVAGVAGITTGNGGRHGEGLVCRKGIVKSLGEPFYQLSFPRQGNFELSQGTLEFWAKMDLSDKAAAGSLALQYFADIPSKLKDANGNVKRITLVVTRKVPTEDMYLRYFVHDKSNMQEIAVPVQWKPGEWHHVAVTWTLSETSLFVDGQKLATRALDGGLFGNDPASMDDNFVIGGLQGSSDTNAPEGVMDDFMISKSVRHAENFTP